MFDLLPKWNCLIGRCKTSSLFCCVICRLHGSFCSSISLYVGESLRKWWGWNQCENGSISDISAFGNAKWSITKYKSIQNTYQVIWTLQVDPIHRFPCICTVHVRTLTPSLSFEPKVTTNACAGFTSRKLLQYSRHHYIKLCCSFLINGYIFNFFFFHAFCTSVIFQDRPGTSSASCNKGSDQ